MQRSGSSSGYPLITICLGIVALVLFGGGDWISFLQYDRTAIGAGEVWRVITGHWLHWSFDHFLWCTITFLAIGSICENLSRKGYLATLVAASLIIPLVCWLATPELAYYRGLSGLASAIFMFGAVMMARDACMNREWRKILLPAVAGLGFAGKVLFEFVTGSLLFVDSTGVFAPVPLAHLAGGGTGLLTAWIFRSEAKRSGQAAGPACKPMVVKCTSNVH
jgi:rhomboid family GlyGly-CTERM serine protease